MNKPGRGLPLMGIGSLLVVFVLLCLVVLTLLTLSTARGDQLLSQASAEAVSAYYQADGEAARTLAQLRQALARKESLPPGVTYENGLYSYECPISENQFLLVEVCIQDANRYTILTWQAVTEEETLEDGHLPVWDGQ